MRRYLAVRQKVCVFIKSEIEFGAYGIDASETDAVYEAVVERVASGDAIAILEDVLASRGIELREGSDGEWGWAGLRLKAH